MLVRTLIEALRTMPQDATVSLCICIGEHENDAAKAEVTFCEALVGLPDVVPNDPDGVFGSVVRHCEDGTVAISSWYDQQVESGLVGSVGLLPYDEWVVEVPTVEVQS